jgi:putative membrane protein
MKLILHFAYRFFLSLIVLMPISALADTSQFTLDFVKKAMVDNQFMIDTSQVAVANSQTRKIQDYARYLIDEHTKLMQDLKDILISNGIDATASADQEPDYTDKLQSLNLASVDTIDKLYVQIQNDAQGELNSLYSDYFQKGDNPEIKDYISLALPKISDDFKEIQAMKAAQ